MQIRLTISDEVAAEATERGMTVEGYLEALIDRARTQAPGKPIARTREQIENFFAGMAAGAGDLPLLPTESLTREAFYEGDR